jgi:ABC-2 type transport system permease protein
MKIHRIYAIVLRHIFLTRRSIDKQADIFYWPTIDLLVWGMTSAYIKSLAPGNSSIILAIISGLVFWNILWRASSELSINLLEELWARNLINIFVSPLRFSEMIIAFLISGFIKSSICLLFMAGLAYILYKVQIFSQGIFLVPFFALLILTGWAIGFLITGILLRYGTRIQVLAWSMVAVISPVSGVYYPISILPDWTQKVSHLLPTSYIFEGMREVLYVGTLDLQKVYMSLLLNIIYISLALIFLNKSFKHVLTKGLMSLE